MIFVGFNYDFVFYLFWDLSSLKGNIVNYGVKFEEFVEIEFKIREEVYVLFYFCMYLWKFVVKKLIYFFWFVFVVDN